MILLLLLVPLCSHASPLQLDSFPAAERALRYKLYTANSRYVATQNSLGLSYSSEVNKFAFLSPAEMSLHHGLNRSLIAAEATPDTQEYAAPPRAVSWISRGHVTRVKAQEGCGACWTFGPTVAIEGAYKALTGKLKEFSNQELLDCVYDAHTYNACHGGTEHRAYEFVIKRKRLGLWRDYPYEAQDKRCRSAGKPNGLRAAIVTGYTITDKETEDRTIERLSTGPLSVAFHAVLSIHFYKGGIYKSDKCTGAANHAVAAVAYTPSYILIKNSWGAEWGDHGLFKFGRGDYACGIHLKDNNFLPSLTATGDRDDDSTDDAMTWTDEGGDDDDEDPTPKPAPTEDPNCFDKKEGCLPYFCDFYENYKVDCRKTCGFC